MNKKYNHCKCKKIAMDDITKEGRNYIPEQSKIMKREKETKINIDTTKL